MRRGLTTMAALGLSLAVTVPVASAQDAGPGTRQASVPSRTVASNSKPLTLALPLPENYAKMTAAQ